MSVFQDKNPDMIPDKNGIEVIDVYRIVDLTKKHANRRLPGPWSPQTYRSFHQGSSQPSS